ncbi:MAG: hypothetical protein ABJN84_08950 [Flavobacteriaceae bacterium]
MASCKEAPKNNRAKTPHFTDTEYQNTTEYLNAIKKIASEEISAQTLESIIQKSKYHDSEKQNDSVILFDRLLLKMAQKSHDTIYIAKGHAYLAYDHREKQQFDSAYFHYFQAQKNYRYLKDTLQVARKLLAMAKIEFRQADYYSSKETLTQALAFLDSVKNASYFAIALNELAHNFSSLDDFKNAEKLYQRAISIDPNSVNKILYTNNLASFYHENKKYQQSIESLKKVINDLPNDFDRSEKARLFHNLAKSEWQLKGKNPLPVFKKIVVTRKEENDYWGLLSSYQDFMDYYLLVDEKKAKLYADSILEVSRLIKNPTVASNTLAKLLKLNPKKHPKLIRRYINLTDSLKHARLLAKNQFAYLKYQDQQEKTRLLALETETALQEVQLAKQETQKTLFLSLSAILLMGGISLYFLLKQRHKKEKLREVYKTEKRISQDLHDGMANDVFGLMTKIQSKDHSADELLNKLEHIYQTTREISHQNATIRTGMVFKDELSTLISSYQHQNTSIITKGIHTIDWSKLDDISCVVVHRSLKELLVNMKKHAKASLVSIQFENQKNKLLIFYTDNGMGIDQKKTYGIGLMNTENRIRSLGGHFIFEPKQGSGAKASISIPI